MKVGIVGLDNSHCTIFAGMLNDPASGHPVQGATVAGAFRGGTAAFSLSRNRIDGFTREITEGLGIPLYDTIEALAQDMDALLIESCDGRQHLEQFRRAARGKPIFLDKPFATSSADALAMVRIAAETGTPLMSCSSLRYAAGIADLIAPGEQVLSCEAFGYAPLLDDYPGLFWYGIHEAEMLFAFMGPGCKRVRCLAYPDVDLVIGEWRDGRIGVLRGTRLGRAEYGCVLHTSAATRCGMAASEPPYFYFLLQKIVTFFATRISPVNIEETLGIIAFLEAANRSKELGGVAVALTRS